MCYQQEIMNCFPDINLFYACVRMCFPSVILYLHYKKLTPGPLKKFTTWMLLTVVFMEGLVTLIFACYAWTCSILGGPYVNMSYLLPDFYIYKTAFWGFFNCLMFLIGMLTLCCGSKRNTDGYEQI